MEMPDGQADTCTQLVLANVDLEGHANDVAEAMMIASNKVLADAIRIV
jgi:hypothetical protein